MTSPSEDAAALRKAMKGLGTDDAALIAIVTSRSNEEHQVLRQVYQAEIKRDLVEDIKSEASGMYEKALVGTVLSRAEWDAKCLRSFIKGLDTNERGIIQHLAHRSFHEVEAIKAAYHAMYGKTLAQAIEEETSGLTRKFFLALVNTPRRDEEVIDPARLDDEVEDLYKAGQGRVGTDEDAFIRIICSHSNAYLRALNLAYGRMCGTTLVRAVQKEMSGWLGEGLEAMLTDHDRWYASVLFKSIDGVGADQETMMRILTSRRHRLRGINEEFMQLYGKELKHRVSSECSGNLKSVLVGLCRGC